MKGVEFPIFKTKIEGLSKTFNLIDPEQSRKYFKLKAGSEIEKLKNFLKSNTFVAFLLGKKNSGKGTYSKLFIEIIDSERIGHISVGDIVREIHQEILKSFPEEKEKIINGFKRNYRGFLPIEKAIEALLNRKVERLLPTEFILSLVKKEIGKRQRKALFIDGFPRDLDQISYSLFFRDLIGYRDDPDIFVLIDVPEKVIDARIKGRVVCPICQSPRNLKLFSTKKVEYDEKVGKFYLICENPNCQGQKMVPKEGDELGIEAIRERLEIDEKLMKQAFSLYGIPKILLRNSVPAKLAKDYIDDYEITPEYNYRWDEKKKKVEIIEKPWIFLDDEGVPSYSLLPQPVVVSLIKQMVDVLNL